MPRAGSKAADLQRRRAEVSQRYCRGETQMAISEALGISQTTVHRDIRYLHKQWVENQITDTNLAIQVELERISNLEREYWQAWERSREDRTKRGTKRITEKASNGRGPGDEKSEASILTEGRDGNPKFLEGVRWCVAKRIDLLGLLPSQSPSPIMPPHDVPANAETAVLGRIAELATLFDAARSRAGRAVIPGTVVDRDPPET